MGGIPSGAEFAFPAYDVCQGAEQILQLVARRDVLRSFAQAAWSRLSPRDDLNAFIDGLRRCARAFDLVLPLADADAGFDGDRVLVLMGAQGFEAVSQAEGAVPSLTIPGAVRADAVLLQGLPLAAGVRAHLNSTGVAQDVTLCGATIDLSEKQLDQFDRIVWFLDGHRSEIEAVYQLGAACDEIVVDAPELAGEIAALNPEIGRRLVPLAGGQT